MASLFCNREKLTKYFYSSVFCLQIIFFPHSLTISCLVLFYRTWDQCFFLLFLFLRLPKFLVLPRLYKAQNILGHLKLLISKPSGLFYKTFWSLLIMYSFYIDTPSEPTLALASADHQPGCPSPLPPWHVGW